MERTLYQAAMSTVCVNPDIVTRYHDVRVLAAFEHSSEYLSLSVPARSTRHIGRVLQRANALWLEPDDIDGTVLLRLLHDMPMCRASGCVEIVSIVQTLRAFWQFTRREYQYPHADSCLRGLDAHAAEILANARCAAWIGGGRRMAPGVPGAMETHSSLCAPDMPSMECDNILARLASGNVAIV